MILRPALTCLALAACIACAPPVAMPGGPDAGTDETSGTYDLTAIGAEPFAARATLAFGPGDAVGGQGPCNRWSANLVSTLPDFRLDGIVSTEMACDDLTAEGVFFAALARMTTAQVAPGSLVLTGPGGETMTFRAE